MSHRRAYDPKAPNRPTVHAAAELAADLVAAGLEPTEEELAQLVGEQEPVDAGAQEPQEPPASEDAQEPLVEPSGQEAPQEPGEAPDPADAPEPEGQPEPVAPTPAPAEEVVAEADVPENADDVVAWAGTNPQRIVVALRKEGKRPKVRKTVMALRDRLED